MVRLPVAAMVLFGALFGGGSVPRAVDPRAPRALVHAGAEATLAGRPKAEVWATRAWALHVRNPNTNEVAEVRPYTDLGELDPAALEAFARVANPEGREPVAPRVVQLVARAAYFFGADRVDVLSAHRPDARGASRHTTDEAVDFKLEKVDAGLLFAHLRAYARVGVGVYTHPGTRYVHVDTRAQSFHWLDASPPGTTWAEQGLTDRKADARDRAFQPSDDLPLFLARAVPKRR